MRMVPETIATAAIRASTISTYEFRFMDASGRLVLQAGVNLHSFIVAPAALFPLYVLHECVDVLRGSSAKIHLVGMFEHIRHENGPAKGDVVRVIERAVRVQFSIVEIKTENGPAAAAAQRAGNRAKILVPFVETSKLARNSLLQCAGSFSVSTENAEIFLVEDDRIRRDQLLVPETLQLKSRGILWQ